MSKARKPSVGKVVVGRPVEGVPVDEMPPPSPGSALQDGHAGDGAPAVVPRASFASVPPTITRAADGGPLAALIERQIPAPLPGGATGEISVFLMVFRKWGQADQSGDLAARGDYATQAVQFYSAAYARVAEHLSSAPPATANGSTVSPKPTASSSGSAPTARGAAAPQPPDRPAPEGSAGAGAGACDAAKPQSVAIALADLPQPSASSRRKRAHAPVPVASFAENGRGPSQKVTRPGPAMPVVAAADASQQTSSATAPAQPAEAHPDAHESPAAPVPPAQPQQDPDTQAADGDIDADDGATRVTLTQLKVIAESCAAKFAPQPGKPTTWISVGLLAARRTFAFEIDHARVADVLNALGAETVAAGLFDVQFSLTKRTSKAPKDLEAIYGIMVDVDRPTNDLVHEVESAGVPMPNVAFLSLRGFKPAYVGTEPIPPAVFQEIAMRLTLAFEGGDPTSWEPHQLQRLPTCLRMEEAGTVLVNFTATLTNAKPFEAKIESVPFPHRVKRALGAGVLGPADREAIRDYLDELGAPAPDQAGSLLHDVCPAAQHSSRKCYVNVSEEGEISEHCLGGHDGAGEKHWDEAQLAELAGVATGATDLVKRFDPLRDLPVTPAGAQYIEFRLAGWPTPSVKAVERLWTSDWARREAMYLSETWKTVVDPDLVIDVYQQRLDGVHGLPPMVSYYEGGAGKLVHDDPSGRALAVSSKHGPSLAINSVELKSTALWTLAPVFLKGCLAGFEPDWCADAVSLLHKAAVGHANVLAKYGVAAITTYALPVAHAIENWSIHPVTLHIVAVTVRVTFEDIAEVDAIEFFLALYRSGRLPFASENDVRLFVMLNASPLLRHIAPGLLGVYWFIGPPGAGKDFMAEMARIIWEAFAMPYSRVSFDISLAGDLEQKRMLEMGLGCVFARAKEAGKRAGMADTLIRLAGTDVLPGRGLYKDEIAIPNTFTYVAESAEDLPDRREISRRTVQINVTFMDDAESKGRVLDEVRAAAKGIIKNLKRLVETRPPEWYLQQSDTGSRPVVPVALAQLLGATLPAVEGEDLTEVYESMATFVESAEGAEHGKLQLQTLQRRRANKVSLEAKTLPSYSLAFFIDMMLQKPGKAELFSPYSKKSRELINRILRETDYRSAIAKQGYMVVEIRSQRYALRIEDGRRFILATQLEFDTKMKDAHAAAAVKSAAIPTAPTSITPEAHEPQPESLTPPSGPDDATFQAGGSELLTRKTS